MPISRDYRTSRATGRKRGALNKRKDTLAYARLVYLPFDLATIYAAAQNFRIDCAKGIHPSFAVWEELQAGYLSEALEILQEQGCNLYPGDNDEPWIQVRTVGNIQMPSQRAIALTGLFNVLFGRDNANLVKGEYFPNPYLVNTAETIEKLTIRVRSKFVYQ